MRSVGQLQSIVLASHVHRVSYEVVESFIGSWCFSGWRWTVESVLKVKVVLDEHDVAELSEKLDGCLDAADVSGVVRRGEFEVVVEALVVTDQDQLHLQDKNYHG